jgi:hypothetical protein
VKITNGSDCLSPEAQAPSPTVLVDLSEWLEQICWYNIWILLVHITVFFIFKWTYPMCAANWHGHPRDYQCHYTSLFFLYANQFQYCLTLILLMWRIWWAPNNARKWQMGFNSAFKGLNSLHSVVCTSGCKIK